MARKKSEVDEEVDRLFTLPPEAFIAARDELAKQLKAEGRDEAGEVKALRRPTVAAWAANQVSRQHPDLVEELLGAGAELHKAQRKALSGVKGGGFREAMDRRRRAVAALLASAEEILGEAGKGSAATVDALLPTFEAASVDQDAGEALRVGRLERELAAPSGFGGVTGLEVVAAPPERPKPRGAKAKEEDEAVRAKEEAARREARELERRAAEARRRVMKARAAHSRAEERAERAAAEANEAKAAAKEAAKELREAEADAKRADAAADRAAR